MEGRQRKGKERKEEEERRKMKTKMKMKMKKERNEKELAVPKGHGSKRMKEAMKLAGTQEKKMERLVR